MGAVNITASWCKGCGICVAFCPKGALSLVKDKAVHDAEKCIVCGMCELYCPDLAIDVDKSQKPQRAKAAVKEEVVS